MCTSIDWPDLEAEVLNRGIYGLSISNGQQLINSENMVVGHVSTPIGGSPSWVFYDRPAYKASGSLISASILIDGIGFYERLFQAATTLKPPFKTSSELTILLESLVSLDND